MAANTMVHVRVPGRTKVRAEKAFAAMGISMSEAVRLFLTRVVADQRIPFDLEVPNAETRAAMEELEHGGGKRFATVEDLMMEGISGLSPQAGSGAHLPQARPGDD